MLSADSLFGPFNEMSNIAIRVITESEEFEQLSTVWDSLLQSKGEGHSIFQTHEWLSTWWRHFGEGKRLNILLIEKEQQVIGIFPFMKTECRIGLFKIHLLETIASEACDYGVLIPSDSRDEEITALLVYLEEELAKGKLVLRLRYVPEGSKFLELLRRYASLVSENLFVQESATTSAPYVSLPATWDEYFGSLSQNRRHTLRRKLRSLEKAHNVAYRECTADTLEDELNKFFELHQRRWKSVNVSGVFSDPKMKEFYRDVATQFRKKGWLHFFCLTIDNEVVSATYCFVYNRKLYCDIMARDDRYAKYSVGHIHHMFLIKDAIDKHLLEVDFLRGEEPHKFHWTKSVRRYTQVIAIKKGICPHLRHRFLRILLRFHEIRQYGLRELYPRYMIRRREERARKKMGVGTPV